MLKPQNPDPAPRKEDKRRWRYLPIANGASAVGYMAGPPCGVFIHHIGHSIVCKRRMTNSELVCAYCESGMPSVWRGYTPIYDRDYCCRFVLITAEYHESVREIGKHEQVRLSRAKGVCEPVVIRAEVWTPKCLPVTPERREAVDIMPFLLRLWKDEELNRWVACTSAQLPGTVEELPPLSERPQDVIGGDIGRRVLERLRDAEGYGKKPADTPKLFDPPAAETHQNGKPRKPK